MDIMLIQYVLCGEDGDPDPETSNLWAVERGVTVKEFAKGITSGHHNHDDIRTVFGCDGILPSIRVWQQPTEPSESNSNKAEWTLLYAASMSMYIDPESSVRY